MALIRRLARPMLAATFIVGGIDTLRNPGPRVPPADKVVKPLVDSVPQISDTEQVVKIDAAVKVGAGVLLALGKLPRLSAAALVASLVPTTAAGHRFWEESDPATRKQQQLHFLKNASMVGGLLLAAVDTEGKPSLAWRAKHVNTPQVATLAAAGGLLHGAGSAAGSALQNVGSAAGSALQSAGSAAGSALHNASDSARGPLQSAAGSAASSLQFAAGSAANSLQSASGAVRDRLPV